MLVVEPDRQVNESERRIKQITEGYGGGTIVLSPRSEKVSGLINISYHVLVTDRTHY